MATIPALPGIELIRAFRGTLDFYCFRGSLCVRSWPRRPSKPRSPAVRQSAAAFKSFSIRVAATAAPVRDVATAAVANTAWTWKDLMYRSAYHHLHQW